GGRAILAGGTVRVRAIPGFYALGSLYPILTAREGVEGAFADVAVAGEPAPFLTIGLITGANGVDFQAQVNGPALVAAGANANERAVAAAVATLPSSSPVLGALAYASDAATVAGALDQLSGEVHAAAAGTAVSDARLVERSVLNRLSETPNGAEVTAAFAADAPGSQPTSMPVPSLDPRRFALWGMGLGSWGRVGSTANGAGTDTSTGGFLLGADMRIAPDVTMGVAGGFTRTSFDLDGRLSSGTNESVFGVMYGAARWDAVALRLGASLARLDIDTSRSIVIPGFADSLTASRDGTSLQAFGELGYRVTWAGIALEPFVGGSVLRLMMDGFAENGGASALVGAGRTFDLGTTTLGLRAQARFGEGRPLTLSGMIGWRHAYGDVTPEALLAFGSGASFAVAGGPVDRDALVAEAGIDWQAMRDLTVGVSYSGQAGHQAQDHAVKGNLTWRF
ncbi:MAG: autotransporter domain-containing protein, partial [Microvirga sp.]